MASAITAAISASFPSFLRTNARAPASSAEPTTASSSLSVKISTSVSAAALDLTRHLGAVEDGKEIIDDRHVGMGFQRQRDGLLAVFGFRHDLPAGMHLEHGAQARPDHFVVIGQ